MNSATSVHMPAPSAASGQAAPPSRGIVLRTSGRQHGPIVRLVSPDDLGRRIKPFVFLDHIDVDMRSAPRFGFHPHSGIATLTLLLDGGFEYEDSTGATGAMAQGAVEWMQAGGGVWHTGRATGQGMRGYQLWIALPPALENAPAQSLYLEAGRFQNNGPARVILGELGGVRSPISAPSSMNYLEVRLQAGETWRYDPPEGHDVAWIALHKGSVSVPGGVRAGELVVFAEGPAAITFEAEVDSVFVLGSAAKHPHPLVLGSYSVHTTPAALRQGEDGIQRIGEEMRRAGKL